MSQFNNLKVEDIKKCHRNRYPWFYIDFIDSLIPLKYARGRKLWSHNEYGIDSVPHFAVGEALEQMFLMTFLSHNNYKDKITSSVAVNVNYLECVRSGDCLVIESKLISLKRGVANGISIGYIEGDIVCDGKFWVAIPEIFNGFIPKN